jgi:hypothetical protein
MGENYLGVPGWVWGAGLGTAALYGAYQLAKGPDAPKGALEPESKPWLYKASPSYWFKSGREKKFLRMEKEKGQRNVELEKELTAAQKAYAVHQAASEKSGKVTKLEKEMTTTSGESRPSQSGADPKDIKVLNVLKKARLPIDPGVTWSPEQLALANQVAGSVLGAKDGQKWLQGFLAKNTISWADKEGVIYTFNQGRVVRTPSMSMLSKESVLGEDEVGFNWKTALLTAGVAPAAYLTYKGAKKVYGKIKGKKKSPEEQRQARMAAAYQRKAAALKKTRAMEKRHLAAIAVKESERDIAEAEAQALESEAALQTAQAIALEAEATKDVPEIAEDLSGWAVMGGCPWMPAGPAHVAATDTKEGATLRRGLAAARAARTNPEAKATLMGIAQRANAGDMKSRQLLSTMKAGLLAENQLFGTHASNLAAKENIVRKNWAKVRNLLRMPKSGLNISGSASVCGADAKKALGKTSPDIITPIPGEPPDVLVAITAAANSMGIPPAVAGSVVAAARAGDKTAQAELNQAETVYKAAQKGDPVAQKAVAQVTKDAKSGYAPAARKAATLAAAVGLVKGRVLWTGRQAEAKNKLNNQKITSREYKILSIKLSRYLTGTGPLSLPEATRGLQIASASKLDANGQGRWLKAITELSAPRRRSAKNVPTFTLAAGLGMFSHMPIVD